MLKSAYAQGATDALARFKVSNQLGLPGIGTGAAAHQAAPNAGFGARLRTFGNQQIEHVRGVGGALHGLWNGADAATRQPHWGALGQSVRGLAPSLLGATGLGLGSYLLGRDDQR